MVNAEMAVVDNHQLLLRAFLHAMNNNAAAAAANHKSRDTINRNNESYGNITKRYLVYMELPKIKIGDYHKSSCVVGNILRFHFLLKIASNEHETLKLLPVKSYKVPVVNVAVIHRPFIDDDTAKGPIPKSPGIRSPLIRYSSDERNSLEENAVSASESREYKERESGSLEDDFRKGSAAAESERKLQEEERRQREYEVQQRRESGMKRQKGIELEQLREAEAERQQAEEKERRRQQRDSSQQRHGSGGGGGSGSSGKKRKKYFVYCELPKVAIGDYRISSVTSSELIHCHFLIKIAKDEISGQPQLRPIKKYKRPRVNFAVIHRSLIVDDEAAGPLPRSPGVKSPMIREDRDGDDDVEVMHATMGFKFGGAPRRSKYELVSQWSLVADERGRVVPELVLSKAIG